MQLGVGFCDDLVDVDGVAPDIMLSPDADTRRTSAAVA
jgi:hypothetical protein